MLKSCLLLFKWTILFYVLLGFLVQFTTAYGIKVLQELIDHVTAAKHFGHVSSYIILYGILLLGTTLLHYLIEYPQTSLFHSLQEKHKIMALTKVSKMDYSSYRNIGTGEWIKVIDNGAAAGMSIIHDFYLRIFHELLPTILFSLFFISQFNITIMWSIAAGYILVFIVTQLLLRMLYQIKASLLVSQEQMSKLSIRGFTELAVFRLNRRYKKEIERLHHNAGDIIQKSTKIKMVHEAFFAIFALLVSLIKVIVLIYGVHSIVSGESSVGVIIALILFIDQVYTPVAVFNVLYVDYKLNRVAYRRFEELLNAPEDNNLETGLEFQSLKGEIEFQDVHFHYQGSRLLRGVSFIIKEGTTVAIVGLSGSGKSTIIKLMLGLLKKQSGRILVDGVDIDKLNLNSLYGLLSYISQEAPIFDTTIRENLLFDQELPNEQVLEYLDKVRLKEKVLGLPDRLDTMVGERGMKLSGGERQRLAFGRILVERRNLVILDEPVSALDTITENQVMEELLNTFRGRTMILVTHKLSFVQKVDKILLVRDGEMAGEGSFNDLLKSNSYFQELWYREKDRTA